MKRTAWLRADFNVAMTATGELVEIQGTAETKPFTREHLDGMLGLAQKGIKELFSGAAGRHRPHKT